MSEQIFRDGEAVLGYRARWWLSRGAIYAVLLLWALICLFPIYWTATTSFKMAPDVMQGNMIPFVDYTPKWLGWRSLGLSPDTIGNESTVRAEFLKRFTNSAITALASSVSLISRQLNVKSVGTLSVGAVSSGMIVIVAVAVELLPQWSVAVQVIVVVLAVQTSKPAAPL